MTEFGELAKAAGLTISASTYDGDTPAPIRSAIRAAGQVVVTNPDMLHSAILPHHTKWFQLFEQLRVIVIDELHTYRGRLRRPRRQRPPAAAPDLRPLRQQAGDRLLLGDDRQPGRAGDDAHRAAGPAHRPQRRPVRRAARPPRGPAGHPPGERRAGLGRDPRPALGAPVRAGRAADHRLRAVAGGRGDPAHRPARVAARAATARAARVRGYRGGYLPTERRAIERGLRDGEILGVVATNALELGVDIGRLDVSVLAGYPGSVAATWQQIGRSGRRAGHQRRGAGGVRRTRRPVRRSITPSSCSTGTPEEARLDPDNLHVLLAHLRAATFELPFEPGEVFGPGPVDDLLAFLAEEGHVRQAERRPLVLGQRELPGVGDLAAHRRTRERRDHRHDAGPAAGARRGGPVQRPGPRPRAGDLHPRVDPVLRGPPRMARAQGVRPPRSTSTTTRTRTAP